jgi:DNA-directed RNA polymerase specialized sigma24 family protein
MSKQKPAQKCDPLLLSFLEAQKEEEEQGHLDHLAALVAPKVKAITKRSLHPDEIFQEAMLRVIERLRRLKDNPDGGTIRDFRRYAAVVASNARREEMRKARPQWHSLKDSLRHLLKTDGRFASWGGERDGMFCGMAQWRGRGADDSRNEKLERLLEDPHECETDLLNGRDAQKLELSALSEAIFAWTDSPIELDDLVTIIFDLKRLVKNTLVNIDNDDESSLARKLAASDSPQDLEGEWREHLEQYLHYLWEGVMSLKSEEQRIAYLLNFDGAGHGLKLFQMFGVATLRRIYETLNLSEEHFARLWPQLGEEARRRAEGLESLVKKFALLWSFLPIEDKKIAGMLGIDRQRVINLRRKARRHLGRSLAAHMESKVNTL